MKERLRKTKARLLVERKQRKPFFIPFKVARVEYKGQMVNVHSTFVKGNKTPLVFLTGLGCSQSDFRKALESRQLKGHAMLLFDFPGQGTNPRLPPAIPQGFRFTMDELAELTKAMLDHYGLGKVVLVGHSMGGVVGRKLVIKHPERVSLFVDIEGPLDLSECQRCIQIAMARREEFPKTISGIVENYTATRKKSDTRYSTTFKGASPFALKKYSESLINEFSERQPLTELPQNRVVYFAGENNNNPRLRVLEQQGIPVKRIPKTGHFVMEDNPASFYRKLAQLIR